MLLASPEAAASVKLAMLLSATTGLSLTLLSCHSRDRFTPEPDRRPSEAHRPQPTLGLRSDSVGNPSVTCRSAENHVEGQLTNPVNSHSVPIPVTCIQHYEGPLQSLEQPLKAQACSAKHTTAPVFDLFASDRIGKHIDSSTLPPSLPPAFACPWHPLPRVGSVLWLALVARVQER